ncbi:unnamed protein product [Closterium sp. NIES-65]|nr:unnamed protein product [Closterium sp. NIES-65]
MAVPATPDAVRHVPADPVAAALAAAAAASPAVKRAELRAAVRELRDRCLFQASSWAAEQPISLPGMPSPQCAGPIANLPPNVYPSAAEQLIGLPAMPSQSESAAGDSREERGARDGQAGAAKAEAHTTGEAAGSKGTAHGAEGGAAAIGEVKGTEAVEGEEEDSDEVLFARALFDVREFRRAAHVLEGVQGRRALFLRCYALYLVSEISRCFLRGHCLTWEFRRAAHVLEGVGGRRALFLRCYALYLVSDTMIEVPQDEVLFARALFDVREFRRAANVLEGVQGRRALFLRCYALYLAGEKRKEEIILETSSQQQTLPGTNQQQQYPPVPCSSFEAPQKSCEAPQKPTSSSSTRPYPALLLRRLKSLVRRLKNQPAAAVPARTLLFF